jgi:hypothetical protein
MSVFSWGLRTPFGATPSGEHTRSEPPLQHHPTWYQ